MSEGRIVAQEGRYQPCEEQRAIAASVAEAVDALLPVSRLHGDVHEPREAWSALEDLGLFSIALEETAGGSGLGAAEEALIVIALGRRLAAPSVFATIGAGHADWPDGAGAGGLRVAAAFAGPADAVVVADPGADLVLVRGPTPRLHAAPIDGPLLDDTLWTVQLTRAGALGNPLAGYSKRGALRLRLLDAAALAGVAEAALEMAVAYAGVREQFGRPIGSFQAIKHRCADMAVASRSARDLVTFAAVALDDDRPDADLLVESAFLIAGSAALENASANIQVHGGIGFSDEADPHLVLKRAQVYLAVAGGLESATDRIAASPRPA